MKKVLQKNLCFSLLIFLCIMLCSCGNSKTSPKEDFTYEFKDGNVIITGYTGTDLEIVIPEIIEDRPVTEIAKHAFKNYDMKSIILPENLLLVNEGGFSYCTQLESIEIPKNVENIYYCSFFNCSKLKTVTFYNPDTYVHPSAFASSDLNTIIGYRDSTAEDFAIENNIKFVEISRNDKKYKSNSASYEELYNEVREEEYWKNISDTSAENFIYEKYEGHYHGLTIDGEFIVIKGYKGTNSVIKIPSQIDGVSVKVLEHFYSNTKDNNYIMWTDESTLAAKEVYIPDSVINCMSVWGGNLEKIRIPKNLENSEFSNGIFSTFKKITLPNEDNNAVVFANDSISVYDYENVEEIFFTEGTKTIMCYNDSLSNLKYLKRVGIPSTVTEIVGADKFLNNCQNVNIVCEKGSYAETFAKENGFEISLI